MKLKWFLIKSLIGLLISSTSIVLSKTITNPQLMMVGARSISLGLNPIVYGDVGHSVLNPATNAGINQLPFSVTSQKIFGEINYLTMSSGLPATIKFQRKGQEYRKEFGISLSYGNLSLNKIPETISQDGLPYQVGDFSAGYHLVHLGLGTNFYEKFSINKIAVGAAMKTLTYYVGEQNSTTLGIDMGIIAMQYIDYKIISSLEFGGSIHNILSPGMTMQETGNKVLLPFSILLGTKVNLLNDRLSIFSAVNKLGLTLATEFEIEEGVFIRAGNSQKDIMLGLGITLDNIPTGVSNYGFKGRFDFNYTQSAFPMNDDPSYVFTLSSLGRSIPKKPEILKPYKAMEIMAEKTVDLAGVGPKNTTIRIYNNDEFDKSVVTNKFGNWKIDNLNLEEGQNKIYIKSYDMSKDLSLESNHITIISDTVAPKLDVKLFPSNSILVVEIESDEKLANISAEIDGQKIRLKEEKKESKKEISPEMLRRNDLEFEDDGTENIFKILLTKKQEVEDIYLIPTKYIGRSELPKTMDRDKKSPKKKSYQGIAPPEKMSEIEVFATDESGNSVEVGPLSFFGSITFPVDKHVHYNDTVLVIGNSTTLIEDIYINREKITIDSEKRFSLPVDLNPGKNIIESTFETLGNKTLTYYTRVLRLVSYPDMNSKVKGRREIEFLSTLKILHGDNDGNFYPKQNVTRQFITKLMVLSITEEEELEDVTSNLFNDVSFDHPFSKYIQAGVNEGLIFAFPDGTFKPEQELTLTEVIYLMSNAGIIDYEEVEDSDRLITRAELAEFLAYTPKFERKIEKLIDWEKGYDTDKVFNNNSR